MRRSLIPYLFIVFFAAITFISCNPHYVYEQRKSFPKHEWSSTDTASFTFNVPDTLNPYQMYFVIRHADAYHYRNIWVELKVTDPDSTYTVKREFKLADGEKWLGTGMDDIFEHRIPFTGSSHKLKAGNYHFTIKQIMREDPLLNVLQAGIRLERQGG